MEGKPLRCRGRRVRPGRARQRGLRRAHVGRVAAVLLAAVLIALAGSAAAEGLSRRHVETHLNTKFLDTHLAFYEYVNHTRKIISETRVDLGGDDALRIVDANTPFEWRPRDPKCRHPGPYRYRKGVLLVHGLTDSPFAMRDVGRHLLARCFLVRSVLLPGHGTVPGDLLSVEYQDWIKAVGFGLDSFWSHKDAEEVYLAGFSTGGTLAILAAARSEPVRGLILFSPCVKIKSNLGFMANWHKTISWADKDKKWIDVAPDEDYAKYESFPFNAADQIYQLTQRLEDELDRSKVTVPIFMALTLDDATIDADDALAFFKSQQNPASRLVLYTNAKGDDEDPRIERRASAFPADGVLNLAHLSLHVSPDNPHYGRHADYFNCMHYLGDAARWKACKDGTGNVKYGEISEAAMEKYVLRRVTYNPDYDRLMNDLDAFLDRVK